MSRRSKVYYLRKKFQLPGMNDTILPEPNQSFVTHQLENVERIFFFQVPAQELFNNKLLVLQTLCDKRFIEKILFGICELFNSSQLL
ncbi:CLUMA_CG011384, isoform A [Clunio marinus]|uniref:CLUMA_CG011384, isoform A n=1 Tax=Clunio marinus TaxID=568069 RepID=A0A1J1ICK4_9DIPT|nr:CLUMA_CG011384, isoform A [Clunio marinus]